MREPAQLSAETEKRLIEAARDAATRAYVPYSHFPVGAAVLTEDGSIISGVNIENASFGLTTCGERTAVFTAAARGYRVIRAVAISAPRQPGTTPCGACRQVLNEFKPDDAAQVVLLDASEGPVRTTLDSLLPSAFGPRDLE